MATEFYAIANITGGYVTLTNTENSNDTVIADPKSNVRTGGKNHDYCKVPDCSGIEFFPQHHMSIVGGDVNIALWNNDKQSHQLYYSTDGKYEHGVAVQGSSNWKGFTCMINSTTDVRFFPY